MILILTTSSWYLLPNAITWEDRGNHCTRKSKLIPTPALKSSKNKLKESYCSEMDD